MAKVNTNTDTTTHRRPSFGVNTSTMSAETPLLPNNSTWSGKITSAGVSDKVPLALELSQVWSKDEDKYVTGTELVIRCPYGFSYGVEITSKKAQATLGQDTPKVFGSINLAFGKFSTDDSGNPAATSYQWLGNPAFRELLNAVGNDVNYGEVVTMDWIDDFEDLSDTLKLSPEQRTLYETFPMEQVVIGLNAVLYYREFFAQIAGDIVESPVMVTVARADAKSKGTMGNPIVNGTRFAPSSGLSPYKEGSENDLSE